MGGVSWNLVVISTGCGILVATNMGGVSWNSYWRITDYLVSIVATNMGGVSWNKVFNVALVNNCQSRHQHGWRELKYITQKRLFILIMSPPTWVVWVEILLSVRWNLVQKASPPTWVVWVEINLSRISKLLYMVAALMGGVSWNIFACLLDAVELAWVEMLSRSWSSLPHFVATHMGGVSWNVLNQTH